MNFLQSKEWRKFQESVGKKTFNITSSQPSPSKEEGAFGFQASIIEHKLPLVGRYFYISKGPILSANAERISNNQFPISNKFQISNYQILKQIQELINLAKRNKAGWIRIEPENEEILEMIKNTVGVRFIESKDGFNKLNPYKKLQKYKIIKAPHDMQPKETLVLDISKSEEEILAHMKSKTRYNIRLAEKKGVKIIEEKNIEEFLRLNKIMAERQGIKTHSDDYYQKMFENIPEKNIKLYLAKYQNKFIAANIVIFYGDTATYLHGASDDNYKNLMAPYLLQWKQIQDAKKAGCTNYDFFGVKVKNRNGKSWAGITRFKLGFAPKTPIIEFPGSYDIIISPLRYGIYKVIQRAKSLIR